MGKRKRTKIKVEGNKVWIPVSKYKIMQLFGEVKTLMVTEGPGQITISDEAAVPLPAFLAQNFSAAR